MRNLNNAIWSQGSFANDFSFNGPLEFGNWIMKEDDLLDKASPTCSWQNLKKAPKIDIHFVGGYCSANMWEKDKKVSHSQIHTNRTFLAIIGMLESLFRFYGPG